MKSRAFMIFCVLLFFAPVSIYGECVKGDCRDGLGVFVLREGYRYAGQFKDGRFHGYGTLAHYNGGKYVGGWKKGQYNGQGTLVLPSGGKYVGGWKDSLPFGKGAWFTPSAKKYPGTGKIPAQLDSLTQSLSTNLLQVPMAAPF